MGVYILGFFDCAWSHFHLSTWGILLLAQHHIDNNRLNFIRFSRFRDTTLCRVFKPTVIATFIFLAHFFSITLKPMPKIGKMSPFWKKGVKSCMGLQRDKKEPDLI